MCAWINLQRKKVQVKQLQQYQHPPNDRPAKWNDILHDCLDAKPQAELTMRKELLSHLNEHWHNLTDFSYYYLDRGRGKEK